MKELLLLVILCTSIACKHHSSMHSATPSSAEQKKMSKADILLSEALAAHGGARYDQAHYQFDFRSKTYTFKNAGEEYCYEVTHSKGNSKFHDKLENGVFSRAENGVALELTEKQIRGYKSGLNSVVYFATLPHKLTDAAVTTSYKGSTTIKDSQYEILEVSFNEEGGGDDHDDVFYYWINKASKQIDFLAYNYQVNNGGVRFRTGQNKRKVNGIVFQDYINYKAEVGTQLADLPKLWEAGKLKKLSEILTENIKSL